MVIVGVAAGHLDERVRGRRDDPDVDDRLDEHEQADEEEQRRPLDLAQDLFDLEPREQEQDRGAEQGDGPGLQAERLARTGSPTIVTPMTTRLDAQQPPVGQDLVLVEREDRLADIVVDGRRPRRNRTAVMSRKTTKISDRRRTPC